MTLGTAALLTPPVANWAKDQLTDHVGHEVDQINQEDQLATFRAMKQRKVQQMMAENTARLAQLDPHTYYEVLAGRRLPQGAVVFGGQPRTDLLERLAYGMTSGKYPAPQQDDLAGL
jgi:hypothetical protein